MTSRLTQEVTAAREALATLKPHAMAVGAGDQAAVNKNAEDVEMMAVDQPQEVAEITEDIIKKVQSFISSILQFIS